MSFRLFVYYCALAGGWAALLGWVLARWLAPDSDVWQASVYGLCLGLTVALGLSAVDALWNFRPSRVGAILARVSAAVVVGTVGGFLGGLVAGFLFHLTQLTFVFVLSWVLLGLLVGVAVAAFDLLAGVVTKNFGPAARKLVKCAVGGAAGGIAGGLIAWSLRYPVGTLLGDETGNSLWSPTSLGFVALGLLIGLLVGLSQVILKEAWVKVEAGFRPGREMILSRARTVIGRAEGCDIPLFADPSVEKQHAAIVLEAGGYFVEDAASPGGTYVNDQRVAGKSPLKTGDLIRVGKSLLRFNERRKQH